MSLRKDFRCRLERAMQKQFSAPSEEMWLGRFHLCRTLVLMDSLEWMPLLLRDVSKQGMKLGAFFMSEQGPKDRIGALNVSRLSISQRERVGDVFIFRL